jgi:hypothetical protein
VLLPKSFCLGVRQNESRKTERPNKAMAMRQAKAGLFVAGFFVLLLAAAVIGEGVIRNEISPWAWTQFSVHAKKHGAADALLGVLLYLAFYSMGFVIPWSVLSFATWSRYVYRSKKAKASENQLNGVPTVPNSTSLSRQWPA